MKRRNHMPSFSRSPVSNEKLKLTDRKGIWGWMMFDWAAQSFFTVVPTFIFGPYFVSRMVLDGNGNPDSRVRQLRA